MIQFTLKCADGHTFDSWFQSADAFDKLAQAGHVCCVVCGSSQVQKAIMAPRVAPARNKTTTGDTPPTPTPKPLSTPANPTEKAIAELKREVEENTEYVGTDFASEARAIHDGDAPERAIWGEARIDDAKKLLDEGVQVAPLPFIPGRKSN